MKMVEPLRPQVSWASRSSWVLDKITYRLLISAQLQYLNHRARDNTGALIFDRKTLEKPAGGMENNTGAKEVPGGPQAPSP